MRVELAGIGAGRAGKVAGGSDSTDLRIELRSLGGTIRRDRGGCALPVRLAPGAGRRRGVVRRAAGRSREGARRAGARPAVLDSARVPHAGWRRANRSGGLRLHAAGAHRRVEPPPQDRVVAARPRGRSVQAADRAARPRRDDSSHPSDRSLPRIDSAAARRDRLDHDVAPRPQPPLCDDRRARSAVADAREHCEAVLPARTRCSEGRRARGPATPDDLRGGERAGVAGDDPIVLGERRARALRRLGRPAASAWTTCGVSMVLAVSPASRSTAGIWAASAWISCPRRFETLAASSTRSKSATCVVDLR